MNVTGKVPRPLRSLIDKSIPAVSSVRKAKQSEDQLPLWIYTSSIGIVVAEIGQRGTHDWLVWRDKREGWIKQETSGDYKWQAQ